MLFFAYLLLRYQFYYFVYAFIIYPQCLPAYIYFDSSLRGGLEPNQRRFQQTYTPKKQALYYDMSTHDDQPSDKYYMCTQRSVLLVWTQDISFVSPSGHRPSARNVPVASPYTGLVARPHRELCVHYFCSRISEFVAARVGDTRAVRGAARTGTLFVQPPTHPACVLLCRNFMHIWAHYFEARQRQCCSAVYFFVYHP